MMTPFHYQECFVCGQANFKTLVTPKDHTVSNETFVVVECTNCQFRFTQDVPTEDTIGPYYASESYISHSDTKKGLINRLYHFARNYMLNSKRNLLNKHIKSQDKKLLDIGAGTGYFLHTMKQNGWQVTGVEPDDQARAFSQKQFELDVYPLDNLYQLEPQSFSMISMWHVLEHVHRLDDTLAQIRHLLKEDGTLIIAVPNSDCLDAQKYKEFWAGWDVPRHLYHFTPKSMERLMENHQFTIVEKKLMPFDPFYISMLSEKYKTNSSGLIGGMLTGLQSLIVGWSNTDKASSVIYVIKKNK